MTSATASGAGSVLERKPIRLPGFTLAARDVSVHGRPTLMQWASAFSLVVAFDEAASFWLGDLWNYADSREDWREALPQALADAGVDPAMQTVYNAGWVARRVGPRARALAPSHTHAATVARLSDGEQEACLSEAAERGWSSRELRTAMRRRARPTVLDGQATTRHTVDVTVRVSVEATADGHAEQIAWEAVKEALTPVAHAHVIAAHALPGMRDGTGGAPGAAGKRDG